ncbi:hypothetical protein BN1708_018306, partial [Verticillium longisporum]
MESAKVRLSRRKERLKAWHNEALMADNIMIRHQMANSSWMKSIFNSLGPNLTPNILVQFVNAEGNILLTTSSASTIPSTVANLLAEFDISLPLERTGLVVDHFNYDTIS